MEAKTATLKPVPRRVWSDMEWELLLLKIRQREVVPVIGPDLMMVEVGAPDAAKWERAPGWMKLESYLTLRLAELWSSQERFPPIRPADLPAEPRFNDFVCHYLDARGERENVATFYGYITIIYGDTRLVTSPEEPLEEHVVRLSPAIQQLAAITDFKLFITTTGDGLLEHALMAVRPVQNVVVPSPAFSKERPTDLPLSVVSGQDVAVYHLFGQFNAGARSFVMTEEDLLEYVVALQARDASLGRLNDTLRTHRLLILGGGFHDWLARFILRAAKPKLLDSEDVLANGPSFDDESLRLFLQRFSPKSNVITGGGVKFVDDLFTKWTRRRAASGVSVAPAIIPPAPVMPGRSIFISYASENRAAARYLRERLGAMGEEAWFDVEQLESGDHWDQKIRLNVQRCTVFVPLISTATEQRPEGYFRLEWNAAALRTERMAGGLPFIFPLVVDAGLHTTAVRLVPAAFRVPQWARFEGPSALPQSFLDQVVAAHREWLKIAPPA